MANHKTAFYSGGVPLAVGAIIGGADDPTIETFRAYGQATGLAFQIQDDVLNLVGDEAAYGKESDGDLREGKRTLMIIRLLQLATAAERARLVAHLGAPLRDRGSDEVRWIRDRMEHYGCIAYACQVARAMAAAALHDYTRLFAPVPPSRDREFLEGLITWVVERNS